jgi:FixJ family two-component response regulator
VTVSVDPLHVAIGLNAGDQVDVWSSSQDAASVLPPKLVLSGLTVQEVASDVVGTGGEIGVVLLVPVTQVPDLVQAIRTGVIDLVKVPVESQVSK